MRESKTDLWKLPTYSQFWALAQTDSHFNDTEFTHCGAKVQDGLFVNWEAYKRFSYAWQRSVGHMACQLRAWFAGEHNYVFQDSGLVTNAQQVLTWKQEHGKNLAPPCKEPRTARAPKLNWSTVLYAWSVKKRPSNNWFSGMACFRRAYQPVNWQTKLSQSTDESYVTSRNIQRGWNANIHRFNRWAETRTFSKLRSVVRMRMASLATYVKEEYSHTSVVLNRQQKYG